MTNVVAGPGKRPFPRYVMLVKTENESKLNLIIEAYETNKSNLSTILHKVQQIIDKSEYKDKYISMSYIQENPTVLNHKSLTYISINTLTDI